MTPLISVIVPVYRAERDLPACLDSILHQTHRALEVILIDDGSPDGSPEICDEYAAADHRIRVIHTENRGAFAARNTGLDVATGEYISFVDADDCIAPGMYEVLLALAQKYDADVAQCEMQNAGAYRQHRGIALGGDCVYSREELLSAFFREEITHGLLNKLFRTSCWRERRFEEGYYHMDAVMLTRLPQFCGRLVRTDAPLYYYNTGNESITRGKKNMLHVHSMKKLFEAFSEAAEQVPEYGPFFVCREIPSGGRLLLPSESIPLSAAISHVQYMHGIFCRHWGQAKASSAYRLSSGAKRLLWRIYRRCPLLASCLSWLHFR